jgi:Lrp/AsnC family leucine-responsive transcriptional regulator
MKPKVKVDEIDIKILRTLTKDARSRLKEIAKDCDLSSAAVSKRIERLKATGVITGSVQFYDFNRLRILHSAIIAVCLDARQEESIIGLMQNKVNTIFITRGVGKENLIFFVVANSLEELDFIKQTIRKQEGVRKVFVSNASHAPPYISFENIELRPIGV